MTTEYPLKKSQGRIRIFNLAGEKSQTRQDRRKFTMYRIIFSIAMAVIILITGCQAMPIEPADLETLPTEPANPEILPTESASLGTPEPIPSQCNSEQFLITQVGSEYYLEHFTLVHEESIDGNLVKASFDFAYQPYIERFPMTMFLDTGKCQLSDREISIILLDPQQFTITPEEASNSALKQGLFPSEQNKTNIILDITTNNRFAWDVVAPFAEPTSEQSVPIVRVVLDVESGKVYILEAMKPMEAHESPF